MTMKIKNLELDPENQNWKMFPMKLKSPSGETILRIVDSETFYSNGTQIEADEEVGAALRRWVEENTSS